MVLGCALHLALTEASQEPPQAKRCPAQESSCGPGSPWQPPVLLELSMGEMQHVELILMAKEAFGWWHSSAECQQSKEQGSPQIRLRVTNPY